MIMPAAGKNDPRRPSPSRRLTVAQSVESTRLLHGMWCPNLCECQSTTLADGIAYVRGHIVRNASAGRLNAHPAKTTLHVSVVSQEVWHASILSTVKLLSMLLKHEQTSMCLHPKSILTLFIFI